MWQLIFYVVSLILLFLICLEIQKELRSKYFIEDQLSYLDWTWWFAILNPVPYFKRVGFWKGYFLYLFGIFLFLAMIITFMIIIRLLI
jgi:hypothetical protein